MEAVFLEDITAMRPSFKAIHNLCKNYICTAHTKYDVVSVLIQCQLMRCQSCAVEY